MFPLALSSYPKTLENLPPHNRRDIADTLDALNNRLGVFSEEFVVIGGANLVLRGIKRQTPDVDILVSNGAFRRMHEIDGAVVKLPPKRALDQGATNTSIWLKTAWTKAPISAAEEMGDSYFPISYVGYAALDLELLYGHACAPLDEVWGSKAALQRPQDIPDLHLIAAHTGRSAVLPPRIYTGHLGRS